MKGSDYVILGGITAFAFWLYRRYSGPGGAYAGPSATIPPEEPYGPILTLPDILFPTSKQIEETWQIPAPGYSMVYPPTMDAINQRVMLHRYAIMHNGVNQGVEPALIASVIHQESQGKADVVTYEANVADYSYGLMQIRWMTAQWLAFTGDKSRLLDPEVNIDYGTRYLRYQLTRYSERTADAVAAYNAGRVILTGKGKYANAEYVDGVISQIRKYREILRWYFPGYDFSVRICLDV